MNKCGSKIHFSTNSPFIPKILIQPRSAYSWLLISKCLRTPTYDKGPTGCGAKIIFVRFRVKINILTVSSHDIGACSTFSFRLLTDIKASAFGYRIKKKFTKFGIHRINSKSICFVLSARSNPYNVIIYEHSTKHIKFENKKIFTTE